MCLRKKINSCATVRNERGAAGLGDGSGWQQRGRWWKDESGTEPTSALATVANRAGRKNWRAASHRLGEPKIVDDLRSADPKNSRRRSEAVVAELKKRRSRACEARDQRQA